MSKNMYDIYNLNEADIKVLWDDCVFVFDSSALLDFYDMTDDSLVTLNEIFKKIENRLMLPNHVQHEYLRKRKHIAQGKKDCYDSLKKIELAAIDTNYVALKHSIKAFEDRVKNKEKHPTFDIEFMKNFKDQAHALETDLNAFKETCEGQIEIRKKELSTLFENDPVLDIVSTFFTVGESYNFEKIVQVVEEGKLRYELKIPPGYGDKKKENIVQVYGDLIIWKQIVEYSAKHRSNIVLITNDISKNDWCTLKPDNRKRIERPHDNLIKELYDASGKRFWMYTLAQFLYFSQIYFNIDVSGDMIKKADDKLTYKEEYESEEDVINLSFKCYNCGKIAKQKVFKRELDFVLAECYERRMGHECLFEAEAVLVCPNCNNEIMANFLAWEYPEDCPNDCDVELDGAELKGYDKFTRDRLDDHWDDICQSMYEDSLY
ncbi:MAG TPA: hypothetical protein GX525_03565 [Bacilli bacterium]|nr:hypothetical protein [Bacilli bacterium]